MTEDELILSVCKEKPLVKGGSDEEVIQQFRTLYKSHAELVKRAAEGDESASRQLRWVCGLKVLPQHSKKGKERDHIGVIDRLQDDLDFVLARLELILANTENSDFVATVARGLVGNVENLKEFVNRDLARTLRLNLHEDEKGRRTA